MLLSKVVSRAGGGREAKQAKLMTDKNYLIIKLESAVYVLKLLEGVFINYRSTCPKATDLKTSFVVDREVLLKSIDLAELFKEKNGARLTFDIRDGMLVLSAGKEGEGITKEINIEHSGQEMKLKFTSHYVTCALSVIESESVNFLMSGPSTPALIRPNAPDESFMYILLPINDTRVESKVDNKESKKENE